MIDVYRNLNRRIWSLRDPRSRLVVERAESVEIADVQCIVHERQRQRAVDEGRRNVHAFVRGSLVSLGELVDTRGWHRVHYNCFRAPYFVSGDFPDAAVLAARWAYFDRNGAAWMRNVQDAPIGRPTWAPSLPTTTIARARSAFLSGFF